MNDIETIVHKHLSLEGLKEGYDLAEQENSNLRNHLKWVVDQIPEPVKLQVAAELAQRIRKPIKQGGVVKDQEEDDRDELLHLHRAIEKLTDHIEEGLSSDVQEPLWSQKLDTYANQLRAFLPPGPLPTTLHEIREGKL